MQDNIQITKKERLFIAAQQMAGMQSGRIVNEASRVSYARNALVQTDELIRQSGCIVVGADVPEYVMD